MSIVAVRVMVRVSLSLVHSATQDLTFAVDTTFDAADNNIGDVACAANTPSGTHCTLHAAIEEANSHYATFGGMYTITLPPASLLIPATYTLTLGGANEDNAATGDLDIRCSLLIQSTNFGLPSTVNANGINDRVFDIIQPVGAPIDVTFSHLLIANGKGTVAGGGIHNASQGQVTLDSVTVMTTPRLARAAAYFMKAALSSCRAASYARTRSPTP